MKLNNEYRFGIAPRVETPRSRFLMHKNVRTTFNAGKLIPIYVNSDIYPGDTYKMSGTFVCRMSTSIHTPMDNAFIDLRAFFVPHRTVWRHFKEFMGENTTGAWTQTTEYTVPQIAIYAGSSTVNQHKIAKGDNLQYMGIPIGYPAAVTTAPSLANCKTTVSALPLRAYCKIWNDWYRDENFVPPIYEIDDDATRYYTTETGRQWGSYNSTNNGNYPNTCAPVYKFKDYFNACLPEPQKGAPVSLGLPAQSANVSIYGNGKSLGLTDGTATVGLRANGSNTLDFPDNAYNATVGDILNGATGSMTAKKAVGLTTDATKSGIIGTADLSNLVGATINAQRMSFAVQRILETSARYGTRYCEVIKGFFGVDSPMSAVLQRPEYLGGVRVPLSMAQVVQTSSTDSVSAQGNVSGLSLTVDYNHYFTKSFTEHGTLMILACVRTEHSYSQGIAKQWLRKNKLDFYWPQLAFLGEQEIKTKELFADGSANDDTTFGFNERWVELRTEQNINTGAFSPDYNQSLDSWHYGDDYSQAPVLSDAWRRETADNIDRTLAVQSTLEDQFLFDSRWEIEKTACIPLRSIPGLLDHF